MTQPPGIHKAPLDGAFPRTPSQQCASDSGHYAALAAIAILLIVAGCATPAQRPTAFDHCLVDPAVGWVHTPEPPANRSDLINLVVDGKSVDEQLKTPVPAKEAWFINGPDEITLCRYEDIYDTCASYATSVTFSRKSNVWVAGQVTQKVCWWDRRVR